MHREGGTSGSEEELARAGREAHDAGRHGEAARVAAELASVRLARGAIGPAWQAVGAVVPPAGDGETTALLAAVRAWVEARAVGGQEARDAADRVLKDVIHPNDATCGVALAAFGDTAVFDGKLDEALEHWGSAVRRLEEADGSLAGRTAAQICLDAADCLLGRGQPSDGSSAADWLAAARRIIDSLQLDELRMFLRAVTARARAEAGDETALKELAATAEAARESGDFGVEWRARFPLARLYEERGQRNAAQAHELAAAEAIESVVTALPPAWREGFWLEPGRQDLRRRTRRRRGDGHDPGPDNGGQEGVSFHRPGLESRTGRLLELIKRLASEHDVERVLERITDSAVELSGAERGFVLLVGDDGQLEPWLVRQARADKEDPSVAFSRSIAEAVFIDGEPIITLDARNDRRVSEYLSVHNLMLKSVACLPIQGHSGTTGVLYLEHRMRRGRFQEEDIGLLLAFADQAAIALENARLLEENETHRRELQEANRELEDAKAEVERLLAMRTEELQETQQQLDRTRDELRASYERHGLVGRSEPMRRVFQVLDRVRETNVPVVLQGESGTGKELVARAIHYGGPRANQPFVAINCGAMPEALLESELFGHVKGAFTGAERDRRGVLAQASGGTLLLDEVAEMPAKMQMELLRVLQDGKVQRVGGDRIEEIDVRIIAASNRSLRDMVVQGDFREDLYYRLNVVELRLPALRERMEDLPLLADHLLRSIAAREQMPRKRLSRGALQRLAAHPLPGNVRQLEHLLLSACVLGTGDTIAAEDLPLEGAPANDAPFAKAVGPSVEAADGLVEADPPGSRSPARSVYDHKEGERQRILSALEAHDWNRARAAKALGMPRRTFYRRLREHDIL